MKNQGKRKERFDGVYKLRMIVFVVFLIIISCALIFYVRIFEKWDKASIIAIEDIRGDVSQNITYLVGDEEYTEETAKRNDPYISFRLGELVDYQVSNPHNVMYGRVFPLTGLLILEGVVLTTMITFTVIEFKRLGKKRQRKT
jgi:hypothetical protein